MSEVFDACYDGLEGFLLEAYEIGGTIAYLG